MAIGGGILLLAGILHFLFYLALLFGFLAGMYWAVTDGIDGNLLNLLWVVPVVLIVMSIAMWIQEFVFSLVIMLPLAFIATLIMGKEAQSAQGQ